MIPYPNRTQWWIIWLSVLTAAHLWLPGDLTRVIPVLDSYWGLPGYLSSADPTRLAFTVLVVGGLLLWQASRWPAFRLPRPSAFQWIVIAGLIAAVLGGVAGYLRAQK
jgi:hypothetical protein